MAAWSRRWPTAPSRWPATPAARHRRGRLRRHLPRAGARGRRAGRHRRGAPLRGRSGIYDVTVRRDDTVIAEFRGRSRALSVVRHLRGTSEVTASGSAGVVVEFSGLTKRFGSLTAVDDLSFTVAPGQVTGFLGPERRRQDHDAADAARPGPADLRHGDHRRSLVRRPRPPARGRRRRARGDRRAPRAVRPRPPPHDRGGHRHLGKPGRRAARDDRHPGVRAQAGRRLLDRDAAAARARSVAARGPAAAGPRRARQRTRPRGHPLAARLPAPPLP